MKRYTKLGLAGLLAATALLVASCSAGGGMGNMDEGQMEKEGRASEGKIMRMDHSKMDDGPGGMSSGIVMKNGDYSDERFIDAMVPHHEGAVDMAEVALQNAEHEQIKQLAEDIASAQEAEIEELKSIKQEEFGTSKIPMDVSMEQMHSMGIMTNPRSLADEDPFDRAFIDYMIPHHRSAIEMAQVAAAETDNPEIENLATNIVEAQKREISQMEQWRQQWYPQA